MGLKPAKRCTHSTNCLARAGLLIAVHTPRSTSLLSNSGVRSAARALAKTLRLVPLLICL